MLLSLNFFIVRLSCLSVPQMFLIFSDNKEHTARSLMNVFLNLAETHPNDHHSGQMDGNN